MDDLKTIIHTLSPEDRKEFSLFVKRQKERKNRKDLELFRLMQSKQPLSSEELIRKLYPEEANAVAYYALRKRLTQYLTDFILLKRTREDTTTASSIRGMLSLAGYLLTKKAERLGWNLLRKAEKIATTNDQYDLLNSVYNLQVEWAFSDHADALPTIIEKRNANKLLSDEDERANIATSLITQKLTEIRLQGGEIPFEPIIHGILSEYQLSETISKRPRLLYKLMLIARSAILIKKDFYSFEPYIINQYHTMEQKYGFPPAHQYYKLSLLYMIAQTLYRNRKFDLSMHYLATLNDELSLHKKSFYQEFYPRYLLLSAANHTFLNRNANAVALLEELLSNKEVSLSYKDSLNAQLNLSFYYFQQGDYKKANTQLMAIQHSDKWCEKKMGREWVLKKGLSELIIQYEFGHIDLTLNKARAIERGFNDLFQKHAYQNVKAYLKLVRQLIDMPDLVGSAAFAQLVEQSIAFVPIEQEDLQAINFYAWLKSKMLGRAYYPVLLELAGAS